MTTTAIAGQVDIKKGVAEPFHQHPARQHVDFVADAGYTIAFSDPAVFGTASTKLKAGHNHMQVKVKTGTTEYRVRPDKVAIAITDDIAVASVGCGGAAMMTESVMTYSTTESFGPTGNILVP